MTFPLAGVGLLVVVLCMVLTEPPRAAVVNLMHTTWKV
jgi:hypothetical protein